ncbi:MAG: dTDP-4-dehydrorhamnose reductase [Acidobacteria bacterium]|nr:dTDP-4-dehydrorhamnose reductase [Acidobacteriota bacterium]MCW5969371.1 dTDP-4-dehydrorhamnose reductase [Blastocatellales bacterium]
MKILITGAGGQLGRALQGALKSHTLMALEHAGLDITELSNVRRAVADHHPDVVINAAAYNNVDAAESDQENAYRLNALGPRNLALATAERGIIFLHVSTDYVFDGTSRHPYHEFHCPNPLSVYGCSKLAGEHAVAALNRRHYVIRTAWLYNDIGPNFPNRMLEQRDRPAVKVVSDQFGSPTYAPHLAEAIGKVIETGAYGTYHMAGRGGTSIYGWTRALFHLCNVDTALLPVATAEFPRPAIRPRYSVLTTLQDPKVLLPPWEEGLEEFARNRTNT